MNHKRSKTRRRVRCTMCTQHRWRGNHRGRRKPREEFALMEWERERGAER